MPVNPRARVLLDLILARKVTPDPGFDPLDVVIAKGLVPQCAMKVSRTVEGGPLARYSSPEPCHCYFEQKVGGSAPAGCQTCTGDDSCAGGKCSRGFCEAIASTTGGAHEEIINAAAAAEVEALEKRPTLPLLMPDGTLPPLP